MITYNKQSETLSTVLKDGNPIGHLEKTLDGYLVRIHYTCLFVSDDRKGMITSLIEKLHSKILDAFNYEPVKIKKGISAESRIVLE